MNHYNKIKSYLENSNEGQLKKFVNQLKYSDLLYALTKLTDPEKVKVFEVLNEYFALKCFKVLPFKSRKEIINSINYKKAAQLLNAMPDDDRTTFLEGLPSRVVEELISLLDDKEREAALKQLGYAEGSVGRLMTPHFVAVKKEWNVQQVFDFIKSEGQNSETVNVIYIIDDNGLLIDDIRIREFLFVDRDKKVSDVMDHQFLSLLVTDKEEETIEIFRKNNRFALPVIDNKGLLLGIVTIDDVLRLAEDESTSNIQKMGGSEALDEP